MNPKIRTVSAKGIHVNYGGYEITAPLPDPIPVTANNVSWDAETLTLSWQVPQEEGDPRNGSMELSQADLDAALSYTPPTPTPPVPRKVGAGQIRAAMIASGIAATVDELDTTIEAGIDALPITAKEKEIARALWRSSTQFIRDYPTILAVQSALGKTDADVDDLFRLASTF